MAPSPPPIPKIFDRALVNRRLDRALAGAEGRPGADFLLRRAAEELADRLALVKRRFTLAADLATPGPHAAEILAASGQVDRVVRLAPTLPSLGAGGFAGAVGDIERLPLGEGRFDLAVSLLALQTANDLPGALIQMRRALKPDGLLLACLFAGDTLSELRQSWLAAEAAVSGGVSPRVAPMIDVRELGGLLQRAGLALPVADLDRTMVRYADAVALIHEIRELGLSNNLVGRSKVSVSRRLMGAAINHYQQAFADPDGRVRATVEVAWITGWAPHESQQQPLKPGSAKARLADALKVEEKKLP